MWRVGVIGCGYWGPNLIRNFAMHEATTVVQVADLVPERLKIIEKVFPAIRTTTVPEELLTAPDIDMVAIATPVSTHYELGKRALEEGKHVLLEKPLAASSREAGELVELAEKKGVMLFVDHTFLFTGAVSKLKEMVDAGELGEIQYYDSTRINLGLHQGDVSVIWDIGPHDLSILEHLLGRIPDEVAAVASRHVGDGKGPYDLAYVSLRYRPSTLAHVTLSWLSPVKVRQIIIGGSRKMVIYDDLENVAKVKVFDCGAEVVGSHLDQIERSLVQYRRGDMQAPKIDGREALRREVDYIVQCLETGERDPINGGRKGLDVVRAIEAAELSAAKGGAFRELGRD